MDALFPAKAVDNFRTRLSGLLFFTVSAAVRSLRLYYDEECDAIH